MFRSPRFLFLQTLILAIVLVGAAGCVFSQTQPSLIDAANKLDDANAFEATGIQNTNYQGGGLEQEPELRFTARYQDPDHFSYQIAMGELGFYYHIIEEGDEAFISELEHGAETWSVTDEPMSQGMDLTSARSLPEFIREAQAETTTTVTLDGRDVVKIEAIGNVAQYPAAIFRDFKERTEELVPFTAWIDAESDELVRLELRPVERSDDREGTYAYVLQLDFTAFGDEVEVPEPAPMADGEDQDH